MATLDELRTGRRHMWKLRDDSSFDPFHITSIDGSTVTVEFVHTGDSRVIDDVVDHTIRKVVNSWDLAVDGELIASRDTDGWTLHSKNRNLRGWADKRGTLPPQPQSLNSNVIVFKTFDEMVTWAVANRKTTDTWGPDRFGCWVPGDSWRVTATGIPCPGTFMNKCTRIAVNDGGLCNVHAGHQRKRLEKQAERDERNAERQAESKRRAETRRSIDETIDELTPLLASLDIRPELMVRGVGDGDRDRIGILLDAESMATIVRLAAEAVELRQFG